ncbi:hypothetical protein K440DRAFT_631433 [Wilcoxina mikolae CBS 423.85]|nr:hypothetical protein K440DRAFT_631433 [Wilcoxina mikolae CBS 423.85]
MLRIHPSSAGRCSGLQVHITSKKISKDTVQLQAVAPLWMSVGNARAQLLVEPICCSGMGGGHFFPQSPVLSCVRSGPMLSPPDRRTDGLRLSLVMATYQSIALRSHWPLPPS